MGDGWFWGNTRGGCGAPLRDGEGNVITNLKAVVKGESPNGKPPRRRNDEYDYDASDRDRRGGAPAGRAGGVTGGAAKGGRGGRAAARRPVNDEYDDYDDYDDDNNSSSNRNRNKARIPDHRTSEDQHSASNGSPKKFMGALQEMNSSLSTDERTDKQRRALEYQEQLRKQIEEKNRQKEIEKRKEDLEKRREYEEFMNGNGRPSPQKGVPKRVVARDDSDNDNDDRFQQPVNKSNNHNKGRTNRRQPNADDDDDDNFADNDRRGGGRGPPRNHRDEGNESDDSVNQYNSKNKIKAPGKISSQSHTYCHF
jgi:hypothetical protein